MEQFYAQIYGSLCFPRKCGCPIRRSSGDIFSQSDVPVIAVPEYPGEATALVDDDDDTYEGTGGEDYYSN